MGANWGGGIEKTDCFCSLTNGSLVEFLFGESPNRNLIRLILCTTVLVSGQGFY